MMTSENTTVVYEELQTHNKVAIHLLLGFISISCLGNAVAIATILVNKKFQKSSIAFICHQCFLDFIIGLYNFLFGFYLLHNTMVPSCDAVGASYVLFVTVSAYNLLAVVVHEECEMQRPSTQCKRNHFCVVFGIAILWFTCVLIQMGVAFLPKEPEYIPEVGACIFTYHTPSNFVLHILWIILVSMAILLTLLHFLSMLCRIHYKAKSLKWALIHRSLLHEVFTSSEHADLDPKAVQKSCHSNNLFTHLYLKRVKILAGMVVTYILFWCPLFISTVIDHKSSSKHIYKGLTILSWFHPATTPVFTFLILRDISQKDGLMRKIYSNIYPMMPFNSNPASQPITSNNMDAMDSGIFNTVFAAADVSDFSECETLLQSEETYDHGRQSKLDLNDRYTTCVNDTTATAQTPIFIQQWDCSPMSPGKQMKN